MAPKRHFITTFSLYFVKFSLYRNVIQINGDVNDLYFHGNAYSVVFENLHG
jgi:hypothetical protein